MSVERDGVYEGMYMSRKYHGGPTSDGICTVVPLHEAEVSRIEMSGSHAITHGIAPAHSTCSVGGKPGL